MQNREELRQKGHDGSRKMTCHEVGKIFSLSEGGGGINIVFGPKCSPMMKTASGFFQRTPMLGAKIAVQYGKVEINQNYLINPNFAMPSGKIIGEQRLHKRMRFTRK
jgi:hypothetical protein